MGRINEDVIDCKKCKSTIVYEPANEKAITCTKCGSKYEVKHVIEVEEWRQY